MSWEHILLTNFGRKGGCSVIFKVCNKNIDVTVNVVESNLCKNLLYDFSFVSIVYLL